jgi:hypothetical protein
MKELDLLVENYFTPALDATDILRLVEQVMAAPDQGRQRNFELAINAIESEGLEYDTPRKNVIRIKDDNRIETMDKLSQILGLEGFVYNPDAPGSGIGRIEIIDKGFGNVYVYVKPKSRGSAAAMGMDYENKLAEKINVRYGDIGVGAVTAGGGHSSDITITTPNGEVKIEAKTTLSADFGQFRVQYNIKTDSWEPRRTTGYVNNEIIFKPLFEEYLKEHMNQNYKFADINDSRWRKDTKDGNNKIAGISRGITTGEFKKQIQSLWFKGKTDYKIDFPFEYISNYYASKGDQYIQIGTKGLFTLKDEVDNVLKIPDFSKSGLSASLRFRLKPTMGKNSATSFTIAVKLRGTLKKSNINLGDDEDLERFITSITS